MNIVVRQSCLCVGTPTNNTKTPECDVQRFFRNKLRSASQIPFVCALHRWMLITCHPLICCFLWSVRTVNKESLGFWTVPFLTKTNNELTVKMISKLIDDENNSCRCILTYIVHRKGLDKEQICFAPAVETSSTSCNNFSSTKTNTLSFGVELSLCLSGCHLALFLVKLCCLNSYFNNITDGVSACLFATEETGCWWCFLFLPRTSDDRGSCTFMERIDAGSCQFGRFSTIAGPQHVQRRNTYNCQ